MKEILLNPGPVNLSEGVRAALTGADLCHREEEYAQLQDSVRRRLLGVYGLDPAEWSAVLVAGSGTAAVEAMITSLVPASPSAARLLSVQNGVYGQRIAAMARAHRIDLVEHSLDWGQEVEAGALGAVLDRNPDFRFVSTVQHETTTGRLNDLAVIGPLCAERERVLLVDGVSSFGGEPIDFEGCGLGALAATANKCLHGAPGVAFVLTRRSLLPSKDDPARTVYLDLVRHHQAQEGRSTAFTPPVHVLYALERALLELEQQGGWRARHAHYRELSGRIRRGVEQLGCRPLLADAETSVSLSSFQLPSGMTYARLHDALKRRGFVIYAGQGGLGDEIFRIANLGEIEVADVERLLGELRTILAAG